MSMTITKRTADKINALRAAADAHDDAKMVAVCDMALSGDPAALAKCGIVQRAAKAAAADRKGRRPSGWTAPVRVPSQDVEDLTGIPTDH